VPVGSGPRVLIVSRSQQVWGAERSMLALAPLLRERGVQLTLASPAGLLAETWSRACLAHVETAVTDRRGLRTAGGGRPGPRVLAGEVAESARAARSLARLGRDFDVLHSNSLWGHLDCALAGRMARRPVVLELHDLVRPGLGRTVLKAAVRLASRTVAVSRAVADTVGAHPHRLRVVPQGVDPERFHPGPPDASWRARLSSRPDEPIIGIVGRVDPEKGIETLLRAVAMLEGPAQRSHVAVVGGPALDDGTYEARLRAEGSAVLGDRCRFLGPTTEVPALLRSLDVLVNASASEPFGLSVLEAQASGVPVIGTESGGIPEFVSDGETGLLVPPGRPDALAAGLSRLLGRPALRHDLTTAARARVLAHHTLSVRADTMASLYRSVVRPGAEAHP
jgi:glycosyltransferase involved in cell wall biosynthesis